MRVTLAGFGGALAGLSFARRPGAAVAVGSTAVKQAASTLTKTSHAAKSSIGGGKNRLKRQRPIIRTAPPSTKPYLDRELPVAWAMACMAFAGTIEVTRLMSPTSFAWEIMRGETDTGEECDDTKENNQTELESVPSLDPSMTTISDYLIGGAIAGAIFKGSAVRTSTGARIDASIMGKSPASNLRAIGRPLSGILPGAALGLLAGVAIVAMEHAQVVVQENLGHLDDNDVDELPDALEQGEEESPIPSDIKAMTNEELAKSIEDLRGSIKPQNESGESVKTEEEGQKEVRDWISALGFKPYPSQ